MFPAQNIRFHIVFVAGDPPFKEGLRHDLKNLYDLLYNNEGGSRCVELKRLIDRTTTLNFNTVLFLSLEYESDCAFQEVKKYIPWPPPARQAEGGFLSAWSRAKGVVYDHVPRDHGEYKQWLQTTKNAIDAQGILQPDSQFATYTQLLASSAASCEIPGLAIQLIPFARQNGGDPNEKVAILMCRRCGHEGVPVTDSAVNILSRFCPNLQYLLR